jgi:hypothetical protein
MKVGGGAHSVPDEFQKSRVQKLALVERRPTIAA